LRPLAPPLLHEDVAMTAGVELSDIHRLEMGFGENGPTFDMLVRIAHALDMRMVVELVPKEASAVEIEQELRAVF
jgi:transcriptional regulator with XRE-family HTH domain